jgi:hypothetical protein
MKDTVVVRKVKNTIEGSQASEPAFAWLVEHLGFYQYLKSVFLKSHDYNQTTTGKPKQVTDFSKTVSIFKKSTGLKLGRIAHIRYWRNDNWTYYQVHTTDGIYQVVNFKDAINALQFKLSVW